MLVLSQNLVLSETEAALPDGVPLILWDNLVTFDNITSGTAVDGYPATNMANDSTNQEWRQIPAIPEENIVISFSEMTLVDGVGIARHNFGSAEIPVSIYVSIGFDSNSPPGEMFDLVAGPQIPPDDQPMLFNFTERTTEKVIIQVGSGTEPARIAVAYVGKLLRCERSYNVGGDFTVPRFGRKTDALNGTSQRGDFLGRIVLSQTIETTLEWAHFSPSWYRTYFDPFVQAAQEDTPFFFAWSPVDYPYEVVFAWLVDDPQPATSPVTQRVRVQLKMGAITE